MPEAGARYTGRWLNRSISLPGQFQYQQKREVSAWQQGDIVSGHYAFVASYPAGLPFVLSSSFPSHSIS